MPGLGLLKMLPSQAHNLDSGEARQVLQCSAWPQNLLVAILRHDFSWKLQQQKTSGGNHLGGKGGGSHASAIGLLKGLPLSQVVRGNSPKVLGRARRMQGCAWNGPSRPRCSGRTTNQACNESLTSQGNPMGKDIMLRKICRANLLRQIETNDIK